MNDINASVIIVTHNRPDDLRRTLQSLVRCEIPNAVKEILIVENGDPESGSRDIVKGMQIDVEIRYNHLTDSRLAASRNFAVRNATSEFVCIFDDDIEIGPGTLSEYVRAAQNFGPGHYFGGPLRVSREKDPPNWLDRYLPPSARGWDLGENPTEVRAPDFLGANFAAFKSDLLSVGGYPEYLGTGNNYLCGGEENYLQNQMLERGYVGQYLPDAFVVHSVPVERCSPQFAVKCYFRYCVTNRIIEFVDGAKYHNRFPPLWAVRKFASVFAQLIWKRLNKVDAQEKIDLEHEYADVKSLLYLYIIKRKIGVRNN